MHIELKMKYKALLTATLVGTLLGCTSTMTYTVLNRATFDLNCPSESIKTQELGFKTIGVVGCGKRATYILNGECSSKKSCQAIMNSDLK